MQFRIITTLFGPLLIKWISFIINVNFCKIYRFRTLCERCVYYLHRKYIGKPIEFFYRLILQTKIFYFNTSLTNFVYLFHVLKTGFLMVALFYFIVWDLTAFSKEIWIYVFVFSLALLVRLRAIWLVIDVAFTSAQNIYLYTEKYSVFK